jgi:copper(I)-binding protein
MTMNRWLVAGLFCMGASAALAQVDVRDAWARPAVPGQMGTGAFMTLTSKDGARLIGAASPVAGVVEIHEMALENNVMRMRAMSTLELPPGRAVQLKPGGHHVMLMDLKRPLKVGDKVPLELQLELRDGRRITQPVEAEVRVATPDPGSHKH